MRQNCGCRGEAGAAGEEKGEYSIKGRRVKDGGLHSHHSVAEPEHDALEEEILIGLIRFCQREHEQRQDGQEGSEREQHLGRATMG